MDVYEATVNYKLIYVFSVPYEDHEGLLKIGDASIKTTASSEQLPPNCELLVRAAHNRIKQETKTAMFRYKLLYTEVAERIVRLADGKEREVPFRDYDVRGVLSRSGYPSIKFWDTGKPSEWFPVALDTVKNAIRAVKEGRSFLTESEKTEAARTDSDTINSNNQFEFELREEQEEAVKRTRAVFRKKDTMLWDCKMRFGKTLTACSLLKECDYKKTIVVTHRPVVADAWETEYHKVFGDKNDHVFQTKIKGGREVDFDEHIDVENALSLRNLDAAGRYFMYFASMQDLRESARVKEGGYKKNDVVFDMDWDLIIYDEAHEGTQTDLGKKVQSLLETPKHGKAPKVLSLTGTAYNILDKYEDNVYRWDYVMEQSKKRYWEENFPGTFNPYADLPELKIYTFDLKDSMPESYRYETTDTSFYFREFFRVWTGNPEQDFRPIPEGAKVGDFVHAEDVKRFLDLITVDDKDSLYPFSTHEYRKMFKHTLWMVPGVKAAAALSEMLRHHPVFMHYKVANVAGPGDVEKEYDDALKEVRAAIKNNPYTITISCGRLTTGVTVPEWTGVMLLAGSVNTSATGYMQTIFRVQSAGSVDGKQKEVCYAFDFAPDRAIKVLSEVHGFERKRRGKEEGKRKALGEFLYFCPVISVDGTGMHPYNVPKLMRQFKRMSVDKAIKSGFDDESVYKNDTGIVMDDYDVQLFYKLSSILSRQKKSKTPKKVVINNQGVNKEDYKKLEKIKSKPKRERTPEELALLEKERAQRKEREKVIQLLRNISIRLPLLIFGADVNLTDAIHMEDFVTLVDDESWYEFMPKGVSKDLFQKLLKYYDEDVIIGAGLRIRRMAKAADELPPTQRVLRLAEIFSLFRNPDKETVLTPWRVVNMHLSDTLGGFCFYDESFDHPDGLLEEPRLVDRGKISDTVFLNPEVRILEMNSKSGLYPLYMAYSIYAMKLTGKEINLPLEQTQKLWAETVDKNIYVLCKTQMARLITKRTLMGYEDNRVNAIYLPHLVDLMKNHTKRLSNKLKNPNTWGKEGTNKMKFDAIVGNPPFDSKTGGGADAQAATQSKPIFSLFVEQAKHMEPEYISMIIPARWYNGGIGLVDFRNNMLGDKRIEELIDYSNSKELFPTVDIAGGICYFLWNHKYSGECRVTNSLSGEKTVMRRRLDQYDSFFVRSNRAISIIEKVLAKTERFASEQVSSIDTFGIPSKEKGHEQYQTGDILLLHSVGQNDQGTDYIDLNTVTKNKALIGKFKVKISQLVPQNGEVGVSPEKGYRSISSPQVLYPGTVDTFSYLNIGFFDTEEQAVNFRNYMTCKFPRYLMRNTYSSSHISKVNFCFVPLLDFTSPWTDEMLYKEYGLTDEERQTIESTMRPLILDKEDIGKDFYETTYKAE